MATRRPLKFNASRASWQTHVETQVVIGTEVEHATRPLLDGYGGSLGRGDHPLWLVGAFLQDGVVGCSHDLPQTSHGGLAPCSGEGGRAEPLLQETSENRHFPSVFIGGAY